MKRLLLTFALALGARAQAIPTELEKAQAALIIMGRANDLLKQQAKWANDGYAYLFTLTQGLDKTNKEQAILIVAKDASIVAQTARILALEAAPAASVWEAKIDARCPTCRAAIDEGLADSTEEWAGVLIRRSRAGVSVPEIPAGTAALHLVPAASIIVPANATAKGKP
jgi:hypothetical protein